MDLLVHSLWLPKSGHTAQEYEDDFDFSYNRAVRGRRENSPCYATVRRPVRLPRFAVADGATESSFSGIWAHQLVELFVARGPSRPETLRKWVEREAKAWFKQVSQLSLPWYAANKLLDGAFSTLLGLCLYPSEGHGGRWTALTIGDSCLFQVRADRIIASLPISTADELGYHPTLLSTRIDKNASVWERAPDLRYCGTWIPGDYLLLMTDAMAHWFLRQTAVGQRPWTALLEVIKSSVLDRDLFRRWIEDLRRSSDMRNDDITLLIIEPN